jgi:hypothetical protein
LLHWLWFLVLYRQRPGLALGVSIEIVTSGTIMAGITGRLMDIVFQDYQGEFISWVLVEGFSFIAMVFITEERAWSTWLSKLR